MPALHRGFVRHRKVTVLSDAAFRVWVAGWAFCADTLTDGVIYKTDLPALGVRVPAKVIQELTTVTPPYTAPLWEEHADHYRMHDYLDWNDSRQRVQQDRARLRQRVQRTRTRQYDERREAETGAGTGRDGNAGGNGSSNGTRNPLCNPVTTGVTYDQRPTTNDQRTKARTEAGEDGLRERALWETYRRLLDERGLSVPLMPKATDFTHLVSLCQRYPDDTRLTAVVEAVIGADHAPIAAKPMTLGWLAYWAPWAEARLQDNQPGHWWEGCSHTPKCERLSDHQLRLSREVVA